MSRRRHLSKHYCMSGGKNKAGLNLSTTAETNFSAAYVNCDTIFTGNSAGPQRSSTFCLYKAKTRGRSQETILKTFEHGQVLFHLRSKISSLGSCFPSALDDTARVQPLCSDKLAHLQLQAPQVLLGFDAESLFVCQNDIMPNQVVFQILITLLEVHYLCERVQTVIRAAMDEGRGC